MLLHKNLLALANYFPKDRMITTPDEIKQVQATLHLKECSSDDIQNYRDMCVMMWTVYFESAPFPEDKSRYMSAMQSITSVIDMEKQSRGMEI